MTPLRSGLVQACGKLERRVWGTGLQASGCWPSIFDMQPAKGLFNVGIRLPGIGVKGCGGSLGKLPRFLDRAR